MATPPLRATEPLAAQRPLAPVRRGRLAVLAVLGLLVLLVPLSLRVVAVEAFEAEGPSMEPTLGNGDRFAVNKAAYGLFLPFDTEAALSWGAPRLGDVVVLKSPRDHVDVIKRVVGLPGDRIEFRAGRLWRNGKVVPREPVECAALYDGSACWQEMLGGREYQVLRTSTDHPQPDREVELVPPDHFYVLGDHRDRSNDSRALGPIHVRQFKGQVTYVYWSAQGARVVQ